ncbi:uncharacterized protein V1510DRAFT_405929 [Dipodascopsis tothii]|uniref:uncharacterized protein n=1 Tax=Dipodascopsis tothii TaxID=44089 RepID=UPI0034CEC424
MVDCRKLIQRLRQGHSLSASEMVFVERFRCKERARQKLIRQRKLEEKQRRRQHRRDDDGDGDVIKGEIDGCDNLNVLHMEGFDLDPLDGMDGMDGFDSFDGLSTLASRADSYTRAAARAERTARRRETNDRPCGRPGPTVYEAPLKTGSVWFQADDKLSGVFNVAGMTMPAMAGMATMTMPGMSGMTGVNVGVGVAGVTGVAGVAGVTGLSGVANLGMTFEVEAEAGIDPFDFHFGFTAAAPAPELTPDAQRDPPTEAEFDVELASYPVEPIPYYYVAEPAQYKTQQPEFVGVFFDREQVQIPPAGHADDLNMLKLWATSAKPEAVTQLLNLVDNSMRKKSLNNIDR